VLDHCWVDIPHIHPFEWDSLFFQSCLLSTVTVTPSDSDYVNRSASLQRFQLIHTSTIASTILRIVSWGAFAPSSSRTKLWETVATRVVTGIRHRIVWFCERYCLAGVDRRGWAPKVASVGKDIGDGGGYYCYVWWRTIFCILFWN